jgi:hypothetical protein
MIRPPQTKSVTRIVISVPTVRTQVRAILMKLGVVSQLEAVGQANRSGWYVDKSPGQPGSA